MPRGGFRPGAGRPKGQKAASPKVREVEKAIASRTTEPVRFESAMEYAMSVINDPTAEVSDKIRLAVAILPFQNAKAAETAPGKREQAADAAKTAANGRFATPPPPKLVVVN